MSNSNSDRKSAPQIVGWIVLVTVFVLVTVLYWTLSEHGPKAVANTYHGSEYHERAKERVASACIGLEGASFAECVIEIDQSARENYYTQKDIRAQRYMAIWAFLMAFAALGALAVTTVGLIWIKGTLDQTREAVRSADDAVGVTREIGVAQTRAYLSVSSVNIHLSQGNLLLPPDWDIGLRIEFENYGVSPAKSVGFSATVSVNKNLLKAKETNFVICNSHVGPGGTKQTKTFQSIPIVLDSGSTHKKGKFLLKRNQDVRVGLKVRYSDVFNRSYEIRSVWSISIQDADLTRFGMAKLERWGNEDSEAEIR